MKFFIHSIKENLDHGVFYFEINRCYLIFLLIRKKKGKKFRSMFLWKISLYSQSHLIARHPIFHRRRSVLRHTREISSLWSNRFRACISVVSIAAEIKSPERMRGQWLLKIAQRPLELSIARISRTYTKE